MKQKMPQIALFYPKTLHISKKSNTFARFLLVTISCAREGQPKQTKTR